MGDWSKEHLPATTYFLCTTTKQHLPDLGILKIRRMEEDWAGGGS